MSSHPHPGLLPSRSVLLVGPTAVGKTEVALALAERLKGEIISVDSMQVYRGMDIGTAKPSPAERARVPHHLIDVCEVTEPFNAARFVELAHAAAQQIGARGNVPIFCGGTGLYFKALLGGLGEAPPSDPVLRTDLEETPIAVLLSELEKTDPETYARIDRRNSRRVVRAIEVIRLTGEPFSAQRAAWPATSKAPAHGPRMYGLSRPVKDLHARIERRVNEMFRRGLVQETQGLIGRGLAQNPTAMQALGYRQVAEHLRGDRSLGATIELVKIRTRQFAKRQMTWFRNQLEVEWLELSSDASPEEVAGSVVGALKRGALGA